MHRTWTRAGAIALALTVFTASPALAGPDRLGYQPIVEAPVATWEALTPSEGERTAPSKPNPALAAGLTVGGPLAIGLTAIVVPAMSQGGGMFLPFLVPIGLTFGHVYAGDPLRGLAVIGLGVLGLGATYAAGAAVAFSYQYSYLSIPIFALGTIGVFTWAGIDAYQTAERAAAE